MIKEIEKLLNFTSEFHEVTEFGKFNEEDGTWSGVVRELLDKRWHTVTFPLSKSFAF